VDHHNISFHRKDVDADGVNREVELARAGIAKWVKLFPKAQVTIGNHDCRPFRLAADVNIPSTFITPYAKVWKTPHWKWINETMIDGVHYHHGTGKSGKTPALNVAMTNMINTVIGHVHSTAGIKWACGPYRKVFGMDTGCGIDHDHPFFNYGKNLIKRPILSAGVVLDGVPYHEIMHIARGERYHRSHFIKKRKTRLVMQ